MKSSRALVALVTAGVLTGLGITASPAAASPATASTTTSSVSSATALATTTSPVLLKQGQSSPYVIELKLRLAKLGMWSGRASSYYSWALTLKVREFQRKYNVPYSGRYDVATRTALLKLTYNPRRFDSPRYYAGLKPYLPPASSLDSRCRTGRVLCASKTSRVLVWVVNGVPKARVWARYGSSTYPTREGSFKVYKKKVDVISNIYNTPMPYSMFFSGGQAVHYSSNFARLGYTSASHGCVNVKDLDTLKSIYWQVKVGDKVVVYR